MRTPIRSNNDIVDYGVASSPQATGLTPYPSNNYNNNDAGNDDQHSRISILNGDDNNNNQLQPPPPRHNSSSSSNGHQSHNNISNNNNSQRRQQHASPSSSFFQQFSPKNYSAKQKITIGLKLVVAIVACIVFIFGAAGAANQMTGEDGFDEVFLVAGASVMFLFVMPIYNAVRRILPGMPHVDVLYKACVVLHVSMVITQIAVLQAYLVRYVGPGTLGFLAIDLLLIVTVVFDQWATAWATVYIALLNLKFYLIWRVAFFSAEFLDSVDNLGPNGLLVACLLTIPVIQFFVLIHRLRRGMDLFSAYTTNMVAVFAHTLHVLDVTALFMSGSLRSVAANYSDSMYLYLVLSITGGMAANLYHVLLFFPSNDDDDKSGGGDATAMNALGEYFGRNNRAIMMMRGGLFDDNNGSGGRIGGGGGDAGFLKQGRYGFFSKGGGGGGGGAGGRKGGKRSGGARTVASLGASEGTQDEGLVHYLMWLVFFVDLPFGSIRLIAWWINGIQLSSLFAKNVMMCVSATHLLVVHSKDADSSHESTYQQQVSNADGDVNLRRPRGYVQASEPRMMRL